MKTGLLVSSSTQTDNEDFDYLDMNFKYPSTNPNIFEYISEIMPCTLISVEKCLIVDSAIH